MSDATAGHETHEFFVVNISNSTLTGTVTWSNESDHEGLDVGGVESGTISKSQSFTPGSSQDFWAWDQEPARKYEQNIFQDSDRYVAVVLSDYGIAVLPTSHSGDKWQWPR